MNPISTESYKVSILVPVYGVEKYIERCAISLFEQTYENIEYIFINDCTKDDSISVLVSVIERYPNRKKQCRIINHTVNKGLASSRNSAVAAATSEFIMHVDSDDYLEENTVQMCVEKQLETNADIISFGNIMEYPYKTVIVMPRCYDDVKSFCLSLIARNQDHNIWGHLIRRSLYIDNNVVVKEGCNMGEDYQVVPVLAYYAKKVATIKEPLYHYNLLNVSSYVHTISLKNIKEGETSFQVVDSFFSGKGTEYSDALNIAKVKIYTRWLINILKADLGKDVFNSINCKIKSVPSTYFSNISFPYRMISKLGNYSIARIYLKFVQFFK